MSPKEPLYCPFCPFEHDHELFLIQHVETTHPEDGESPFIVKDSPWQELQDISRPNQGKSDEDDYIECMCGEFCLSSEFDSHLEMHYAEDTGFDDLDRATIDNLTPLVRSCGKAGSSDIDTLPWQPVQAALSSYGSSCSDDNSVPVNTLVIADSSSGSRHEDKRYIGTVRPSISPTRHYHHSARSDQMKRHKPRQRLGKAELGPHADEEQMPDWLRKMLQKGAKVTFTNQIGRDGRLLRIESVANECRGLLPVISQLCAQDDSVARAYLCHPEVTHVVKMQKEGGFCGYRNIQMMISFIQETRSNGHENFPGGIPSILHLQDMIEQAWDMGFRTEGRIETGGIKNTRKYIGTPEAQALLESLRISCCSDAFNDPSKIDPHQQLLTAVEAYFTQGTADSSKTVCKTSLPPIYFQYPGHSLTIVGFERRRSGVCNLLVFDPMFQDSPGIRSLIGHRFGHGRPEKLLKAYRRGESFLNRFKTFEILKLGSRPSSNTGWDHF